MSYVKNIQDWTKPEATSKPSNSSLNLKNQFNLVDDQVVEVKRVVVHSFIVSDSDDPELHAAQPLYEWQHSEQGQWVMSHAVETPIWNMNLDAAMMGYRVSISAKLTDRDYTFWALKWR